MTDAKRMDVHAALEEVRAQKEKLEEEMHTKMNLCNNMKKAQDELIAKVQEAKLLSEKQAHELSAKSEELSTLSQLYQDLKSSFQEKELSLKQLNSAIKKLRYENGEKLQKLESENKDLILALDESTATCQSLKSKINASNMEIEDLKRILSLKDKKIVEITDTSVRSKDLTQRDEVISKLEEKHRNLQDQLKWKNEKFQHLEEAHERLQDNFQSSKVEWEREKSSLLEEICSLETKLDSQTRISENLQTQLRICNQALACEETKKKLLEAEVSEYKSRFVDIFLECHEAKATIEKLSHQRDEEVAELRDTLAAKDSLLKEMGYKMAHLEQENKDLTASLKELQESQIAKCGNTGSLKKFQKKYQGLEQVHKKCSENLKEKEAEWKSELEKARKETNDYLTELKIQSEQVKQLQKELESSDCLTEVHNEEMSTVVFVFKSQFSVAYSELFTEVSKLKLQKKENEDTSIQLKDQLEIKNNALCEVNAHLSTKCEEMKSLMEKVESFNEMKQHYIEELHRHKKMLAESTKNQNFLEEQIRVLENSRNQDNTDGLSLEKEELETNLEACKIENQMLVSKTIKQNEKIVDLQLQLLSLERLVTERTETVEAQNKEKDMYYKMIEDKETSLKNLLTVSEQEKKSLLEVIEERNERIEEYVKAMTNTLMISEEKQTLIDVKHQALRTLDYAVSDLCEKLKVKDESLLQSSQHLKELEALLHIKRLENENLQEQFEKEKTRLEEIEVENRALHEDIKKLLSYKEGLLIQTEIESKQMNKYFKDVELTEMLEKMLQKFDAEDAVMNLPSSPLQMGKSENIETRLPLVALNN